MKGWAEKFFKVSMLRRFTIRLLLDRFQLVSLSLGKFRNVFYAGNRLFIVDFT